MLLRQLFDQKTWTYTYILADPNSYEAVIIDPVLERVKRDLELIAELGLELKYILDTHVHADHVTGSGVLREKTQALTGVSSASGVECADLNLLHGDSLNFGIYELEVRSTPGHTSGCLTFVVTDEGQTSAFTGDTLLIRGCGRTDFQGGDPATLYRSVRDQILTLPNDTIVYPGHDYQGHRSTTVLEEKNYNPRLNTTITESEFVRIMNGLDLDQPKKIHEALPANLACGFSEVESNEQSGTIIKEVDPETLKKFGHGLVIDVRGSSEFYGDLGHLPRALLVPLQELEKRAESWRREEHILVVCRSGHRSLEACKLLVEMGFRNVANLTGGMMEWKKQREFQSC